MPSGRASATGTGTCTHGASPSKPVGEGVRRGRGTSNCGCRPTVVASPSSTNWQRSDHCEPRDRVTAVRTLVVRCPDWAVIAAGVPLTEPAAVFFANRVVASSPAARREGVATNMRRREAQGRCPELIVLEHDPARDAREFEPIVAALDELTPRIEVSEAGRSAFPTRGPARYFGGDDELAQRALALVRAALDGRGVAHVGVADGPFAALLAATDAMTVVPRGMSPTFLMPWPLSSLDRPELVDVLHRLGLRTLGDLAALPAQDVP